MKRIQPYITSAFEIWKETDRNVEIKVNGNSMNPLISIGDRISIRLVGADELKMGDIFVFWKDGNTVVHRFIKKRQENGVWQICEKGDNCTGCTWIKEQDVLGKVEVIYGSNYTFNMFQWPWTLINPVLGFLMLIWTGLYENALRLKSLAFGTKSVPVLSTFSNKLGKGVNTIFRMIKIMIGI